MRFGMLGPLEVWNAAGDPVAVPERKVRTLLAALLISPGKVVSADRLADRLWGDSPPENYVNALQATVSRLRRILGDAEPGGRELLSFQHPGYVLRVGEGDVDTGRFASLTDRARAATGLPERAALITEALALWRGPALADFEDDGFVTAAAARWEEDRLTAVEDLAEARLGLGEHGALADELTDVVRTHPSRERLRGLHMQALYVAGRQTEALHAFDTLRHHLTDGFGVDPDPALVALHQAILRHDAMPGARRGEGAVSTNLPSSLTALIGRDSAVSELRALLDENRLVTLTGPGGVGKTRLAVEVARPEESRRAGSHPDGCWLVELAPLAPSMAVEGETAVAEAVLRVLGIRELTATGPFAARGPTSPLRRLVEALRDKRMLLVLDNCEHLVGPVARVVVTLLRSAPAVSILATSQDPLAVAGERVWAVPSLDLPESDADAAQSSAVRLFAARAAAATPGFALTSENAATIAAICGRLDGIPLAIELAAPRVRVLGVSGLLYRLEDRFRLVSAGYRDAPPRQQTLRAMIDWSYSLLTVGERVLLRRLSVFSGGCVLDAVEAVCADDELGVDEVPQLLGRLTDRSLVVVDPGPGGPRFRMSESVTTYAVERLYEAGESALVGRRYCAYYAVLAATAETHLHGPAQQEWFDRLDVETPNLRRALERAPDRELRVRLVNSLTWYWVVRARFTEADRWFSAVTGRGRDLESEAATQAAAWHAGICRLARGTDGPSGDDDWHDALRDSRATWFLAFATLGVVDMDRSRELALRAVAEFRADGDDWGLAAAASTLAVHHLGSGDLAAVRCEGETSMKLFEELGDRWGQLQAIYPLAAHAEITGDLELAGHLHARGLQMAEELGLMREASDRMCGLARIALLTGDFEESWRLHEQSRKLAIDHGYRNGEVSAEIGLGLTARRAGDRGAAALHLRRALEWGRRSEFAPVTTLMLTELGFLAEQSGDSARALQLHTECLDIARRHGDPRAVALAFEGMAGAQASAGRPEVAAALLGTATAVRADLGVPLPPAERRDVDRISDAARRVLGVAAFDSEFSRGEAQDSDWFQP